MKTKLEPIGIQATDYPDFDYVIDQLINLAEAINENRKAINELALNRKGNSI